jgi:hypothetical protein
MVFGWKRVFPDMHLFANCIANDSLNCMAGAQKQQKRQSESAVYRPFSRRQS